MISQICSDMALLETEVSTIVNEVSFNSIDTLGVTPFFIKIDVEGFEQQVLMGGRQMLAANGYPKILFESWPSSKDSENIPATKLRADLFEFLKGLGYTVIIVNGYDNMFLAEH